MKRYLSPKKLAEAIDASESSVKRWCDQGRIPTLRTAGGHRRIVIADVLRFLRESGYRVVRPEILGLERPIEADGSSLESAATELREELEAGRGDGVRAVVTALYLAQVPVPTICDRVIAPAFAAIGAAWSHGDLEIYQERRASEIIQRALHELRLAETPPPPGAPLAIGGSMSPDLYSIPSTMAELCLRDLGLRAESLGPNNPATTLAAAVREQAPRLFWLSVSFVRAPEEFLADYDLIATAAEEVGAAVVVGGFALAEDLRKRIPYAAYGDSMTHLTAFAAALLEKRRELAKGV